jgi:hypothetical protein
MSRTNRDDSKFRLTFPVPFLDPIKWSHLISTTVDTKDPDYYGEEITHHTITIEFDEEAGTAVVVSAKKASKVIK